MRSVPKGSFERIRDFATLWRAWEDCRAGKRRQPRMARFDLDAGPEILALHRELAAGRYRPSPYRVKLVRDPKLRLIAAPAIRDRIVQRALLDTIGPVYERSFIDQSFAVLRGRGPHRAAMAFLGLQRRRCWRLTLDVHHYFASVDHQILLSLFARRLRDKDTMALIAALLASGDAVYRHTLARRALLGEPPPPGCGLPLGGYLSHWSGGFYLDGLDHFIKRELEIGGYLRYMDDLALFDDDALRLLAVRDAVGAWLWQERRLTLKDAEAKPVTCRRPAVFVGFRINPAGLAPGPKARRRLAQRMRNAEGIGLDRLEQGLRSYRGILKALG